MSEVEKLVSLKGIPIDTFDSANISNDSVKKEEPSDNSDFENIPNKSSKTRDTVERENDSDNDSSAIISDEEDFTETKDAKVCPVAMPSSCVVCGDSVYVPPSS